MSARLFITIVLLFPVFTGSEIIQFSKLKKEKSQYTIKRDIFSPDSIVPGTQDQKSAITPFKDTHKTEEERKMVKKLEQQIFFEGYIVKNSKHFALLNINGEYFVAGEGDVLAEGIKVEKIEKKKIFLKIDSRQIEILLKGS